MICLLFVIQNNIIKENVKSPDTSNFGENIAVFWAVNAYYFPTPKILKREL